MAAEAMVAAAEASANKWLLSVKSRAKEIRGKNSHLYAKTAAASSSLAAEEEEKQADDTITVACSNSQKVDYLQTIRSDHEYEKTALTPPKANVVLPPTQSQTQTQTHHQPTSATTTTTTTGRGNHDNGSSSISTKTDSILGKTINITNSNIATERIYLESLHAQVLAELKVHVADEEIRLALDSRLKAIQDYYKRKATVVCLTDTTNNNNKKKKGPGTTTYHDHHHRVDKRTMASVLYNTGVYEEEEEPVVLPLSPGSDPSNVIPYPAHQHQHQQQNQQSQFREHSRKFAFERVQGKIDEAIKAAHSNSPKTSIRRSSSDDRSTNKEEKEMEVSLRGGEESVMTPIPLHIFTKDTFWEENDQAILVATPSSIPAAHPATTTTTTTNSHGIERTIPPNHDDTIQNAWSFYRNINRLIFDSRVYDYEFASLQKDPLYPYLNSLMGIADSGEDGYANEFKRISQKVSREYATKSSHRICHMLSNEAERALPELKAICAYIGSKLGMQTMAVGPIKKPSEALLKCEKKYGGDPLLVTDYCRASLFVKDVATLLALIEIVLSKYSGIVRRIKLSSLKSDHMSLIGGYRDVKINVDIGGHVCEIQVHLIPMWLIKERSGYAHYKECCEHNVDDVSKFDIGKTLQGLDRGTLAELLKMGEDATRRMSIVNVQKYHEEQIRDYFALANLYMAYGLPAKAEYIMRRIIRLRSETTDFGPCHAETLLHMGVLRKSLKSQHKYKSALAVKSQITKAKKKMQQQSMGDQYQNEPGLSELCHADQCGAIDYVCDMILDPSKKERVEEKRRTDSVEESRALWLRVRRSYFN
ncbi:hypothetical protein ACHAXR_008361 [Thalassiosira sp. AJA248-18]